MHFKNCSYLKLKFCVLKIKEVFLSGISVINVNSKVEQFSKSRASEEEKLHMCTWKGMNSVQNTSKRFRLLGLPLKECLLPFKTLSFAAGFEHSIKNSSAL